MPNTLSLGGINLPLQTVEMQGYLDTHFNLEDTKLTLSERPYPGKNMMDCAQNFRLPQRRVRLGEFFYPCNAARWGYYHSLIDQAAYRAIAARAFAGGSQPLSFQIGNVATPMFVLPARPLAVNGDGLGLYLMTLVDGRYWWTFSNTIQTIAGGITPWHDLMLSVATNDLSITLTIDTIPAVYQFPDPDSDFSSVAHENCAIYLDGAAYNCGHVIVRGLNDTYRSMSNSSTSAIINTNLRNAPPQFAGGNMFTDLPEINAVLPSKVVVSFPNMYVDTQQFVGPPSVRHRATINCQEYTFFEIPLSDFNFGGAVAGHPGKKLFHDTARAYRCIGSESTDILNQNALHNLARQIALDYYQSQLIGVDVVLPDIVPQTPNGGTDVTWVLREGQCFTRIQKARPFNQNFEELVHWTPPVMDCGYPTPGGGSSGGGSSAGSSYNVCVTGICWNVTDTEGHSWVINLGADGRCSACPDCRMGGP